MGTSEHSGGGDERRDVAPYPEPPVERQIENWAGPDPAGDPGDTSGSEGEL